MKKIPNILQIPIYSLAVYKSFVILGGGGGNEIENKMQVYSLGSQELSSNILTKLIHEEATGADVAQYMSCANMVSHNMSHSHILGPERARCLYGQVYSFV